MTGIEMAATETTKIDVAVGRVLGASAVVLGAVGFFAGLTDRGHARQWDMAALVLALSAGAVALDELTQPGVTLEAWLITLLRVVALGAGGVGLVVGLSDSGHDFEWQAAAIVFGVLGLAAKTDSLRSQLATGGRDGFTTLACGFGLLAIVLAGIGFSLGLNDSSHSATWLSSGVISAVIALSSAIAAAHRALLSRKEGEMNR